MTLWPVPAGAADVTERFLSAPAGLYDAVMAQAWRKRILSAGHTAPADQAFRALIGRDPEPAALMRRFAPTANA
jgi:Zn-dependent oligopeptidase